MRWVYALGTGVSIAGMFCWPVRGDERKIDWDKERKFWAFKAPVLPELPGVQNKSWVRNGIDRFILHRIENEGMTPAPEAEPEHLIRRLSLDLTGLPPSQEGFDHEVIDEGPDPYASIITQLLDSPRYGERMASFWMPVARYAEDQPHGRNTSFPGAHFYRQWVIDAFNRDLPYDQFVRKQLAADLYEAEQDLPALGFLALGPYPPSGSNIEQRADAWADRVDLVTRGFLGLSVACARCHDHLYDPISCEDYYSFAGIFASIDHDVVMVGHQEMHIVSDAVIRELRLFKDGDPENPGPLMPRRNVRLLSAPNPDLEAYQIGSGRRELAEEFTSPDNPLLARVFVNRVWGEVFGEPLVSTPSNFGHSGERPSHPGLLDYLAVRLVENGWSIKWLVRELVSSATYRQETVQAGSEGLKFFAGMKRRRLTAEMLRDSMLVATGELEHRRIRRSTNLGEPSNLRRTVFGVVSRRSMNGFLKEFDYPDPSLHAPRRTTTITPSQKLFLLNSAFVQARAEKLAMSVYDQEAGPGLEALYQRLFARPPSATERQLALDFFNDEFIPQNRRWVELAQVLFSSNSFIYRD